MLMIHIQMSKCRQCSSAKRLCESGDAGGSEVVIVKKEIGALRQCPSAARVGEGGDAGIADFVAPQVEMRALRQCPNDIQLRLLW
jgi:hypothetical protein